MQTPSINCNPTFKKGLCASFAVPGVDWSPTITERQQCHTDNPFHAELRADLPTMRRMSNSFSSLGSSQRGNTKQPDGQDVSSSNNLPKVPINPRREQHNNSHKDSRSVTTPLIDSAGPVATSPSAHLHSLPAVAELLSARKLYRSSYVWRLDHHPAAAIKTPGKHGAAGRAATTSQPPAFRRYYMRLEDCLLCFWPDDELKRAQAENGQVHPTSMNLTDAFVALTSTKPEWIKRCQDCNAPTPYSFSLNNAGA